MNIDRIIFFGTPQFAVPALDALVRSGKKINLVVTQPDQPFGRGKKLRSPPVKDFCDLHKLECIQPESIKTEQFNQKIKSLKPDLMVVAAFGRIFPPALLECAPFVLNIHASLLPRWRGASPISQSILHGDEKTGISIMKLVPKLDAGPVMLAEEIPIDQDDDTETLTQKLSDLGGKCILEAIQRIENGNFEFVPQNEKHVTFAPLLHVENAKISWNQTAQNIQRHIRAFSPHPGAFTSDAHERIKIFKSRLTNEKTSQKAGTLFRQKKMIKVSCADQWLEIIEAQRENKTRQGIVDFLNGYPQDRMQWQ